MVEKFPNFRQNLSAFVRGRMETSVHRMCDQKEIVILLAETMYISS